MAVKKLISSPSASSSSSSSSSFSDSSFERFVAQRSPSLRCKQCDSEGEEKESEDSSSSSDEDEKEDKEETKSPATKSHQPENEGEEKESESEDSSSSDEDEEEEDKEQTKSPTTISIPHSSQQSSEEEDAKSPVENSESHQPENKKLKPNSVPAKKQISSPSASSSSSDDANDSSSDEEQFVAQPASSLKRKQQQNKEEVSKDSSSDEEEHEEKAKSPATKCVSHPSQAQQSCTKEDIKEYVPHPYQQSSEEEEKEEQEEDVNLPVEYCESLVQLEKKKLKPNSVPAGKSSSTITNSAVQRVWSVEDELVLLHALFHYHNTYGKLPSSMEYDSFLTSIIGSLSFPATEKQLGNKIRTFKTNYGHRKKNMGSNAKSLNPHEKVVFQICARLFGDAGKTKSVEGMTNSFSGDEARFSIYLRELISRQKLMTWLSTVEDAVQQLGESKARDLEAKAKQLSIDAMKLHAREEKLMADSR